MGKLALRLAWSVPPNEIEFLPSATVSANVLLGWRTTVLPTITVWSMRFFALDHGLNISQPCVSEHLPICHSPNEDSAVFPNKEENPAKAKGTRRGYRDITANHALTQVACRSLGQINSDGSGQNLSMARASIT
jgi:hypothetical protein